MKLLISLILLLSSLSVEAEVKINRPDMVLTDENGIVIQGLTPSQTEVKAMEKASNLPDGVYILKRPDITITVTNNLPIADGAYAFKGVFMTSATDSNKAIYNWKMISGLPTFLLPSMGDMELTTELPMPHGLKFNVLAVEEK